MALKLKYKDEHGVLHINMSPASSPPHSAGTPQDIADPKFDTINNRFGQYDLFGTKYEVEVEGQDPESQSLFRSRYNSVEEELANTPYAFAERLRVNNLDVTIEARGLDASPSQDLEDDRFFNRSYDDLFGPELNTDSFTVTQLIHAQDRYFDLSSRQGSVDSPRVNSLSLEVSARKTQDGAFKVLPKDTAVKAVQAEPPVTLPVVPTAKRKRESSFAILAETPVSSRPTSPHSLPVEISDRSDRVSPFKGRGFREETSRHNTPRTSATNSRANSPPRRRTNSLSRIDKMAQAAALPLPIHNIVRPASPRNFLKENIEEVRELSELNREKNEAEAERKRIEEEEAILKEMGLSDKDAKSEAIRSIVGSRTTSRSNSPGKINLRSRSNSPAAILRYENIPADSREFINVEDGTSKPVTHRSRVRSISKSQPQSNEGSPKHSKIPKRQNSVSPARAEHRRGTSNSRRPVENGLKNQRFISNSTSSINETIRVGSQVHDKRNISKSTQHLSVSQTNVAGKPPISPGRVGPPPSNKAINPKRLSPIVGTPNKSPIEDLKPSSAKIPTKHSLKAMALAAKTAGNTPATSRLNSRQPSRNVSRDSSPEKSKTTKRSMASIASVASMTRGPRRTGTKDPSPEKSRTTKRSMASIASVASMTRGPRRTGTKDPSPEKSGTTKRSMASIASVAGLASRTTKPVDRVPSIKTPQKSAMESKPPMNRTNSQKSLTPSIKTLLEKPPLNNRGSKKDLTEVGSRNGSARDAPKSGKVKAKGKEKISVDSGTDTDEVSKQDNQTQYDKLTNEKGELVIMTKKNIVSMTTAAITSQPLEVVTTVTNQLPVALEKAREKAMIERLNSKDSLMPKNDSQDTDSVTTKSTEIEESKEIKVEVDIEKNNEEKKPAKVDDKKPPIPKPRETSSTFVDENVKLKPLQPPYNNPQVERVKQKIDEVLKSPEVSTENILAPSPKPVKEARRSFKSVANKTKPESKDSKNNLAKTLLDLKDQVKKQNEKQAEEMRSEATKIVDSIITPVEEPKKSEEKLKDDVNEKTETVIMVVSEKKNGPTTEKVTETLVKGEPDVEVQSSNVSTPGDMMVTPKKAEGTGSDKSTHSNGGFPQSTSTTPKPPARSRKPSKDEKALEAEAAPEEKKPNICSRLMGKCKSRCCPCCVKGEDDDVEEGKGSRWNCFKKSETDDSPTEAERATGKAATIEYETETHRKRSMRELLCGCCKRQRRVSDASALATRDVTPMAPGMVNETSCCGRRNGVERRDSILSDRPPAGCCARLSSWARGICRREQASRRPSMFSKNKSMSPTIPPEDTRKKLDPTLVEHTSLIKSAIPILPIVLAYFCLFCNVVIPGLGTILSGLFCVCFGIPRFGVYDGAKQRIGSLVINLIVGCGQLFTVMFCLVGWGWSIWWGVIMLRAARKYRKLKAEEAAAEAEAEAAPPVTANNHTRA